MPNPTQPTILIVDDREQNRYIIARVLRSVKFVVLEAATGHQALELARDLPDLIILDINLPDISGFEICRRIKTNPLTSSIPILHLSASFVSNESRVMSLEGGADGYLTLPLEPTVLLATVRALLRLGRAESLSRLSAKQWQATFDSLSEGIGLLDLHGRILRCNHAMTVLLGRSYKELIDYRLRDVLMENLNLDFEPSKTKAGEKAEVESRGQWFNVSTDPVLDAEGKTTGTIFVLGDITDRKKAEEALRISEGLAATGRLAHSIAHEINNPLEALTNILYLMSLSPNDEPNRAYLALAQKELERVSRITKQTLAFHRESSVPVNMQVSEVVENVLHLYAPQLGSRGICVRRQFRNTIEVAGFPAALQQVFSNLITNSMEAIQSSGTITIRISNSREWRAPKRKGVRITVQDTGTGIPAEVRGRIFEAFYTTKDLKGSGLGLWLSLGIIHKHQGSMQLRSSTKGHRRGTCFSIFLPARVSSGYEVKAQQAGLLTTYP